MERVGDWVCLSCDNLNFSFRDVCNRCDRLRIDVGRTIMSQEELDTRQTVAPITTNTDEQFQILCEIALKKAAMRDQQTMDPMYPL